MSRTRTFVAILLALSTVLVISSRPAGQARSLAISATSDQRDELREWDQRVDQMVRVGELQLRERHEDTLMPSRTHERFDQVFRGVPVWGSDLTRQSDVGLTVSLFGFLYSDVAVDVEPKLTPTQARDIVSGLAGGVDLGSRVPELLILPIDGGGYTLTYRCQAVTSEDASVYFIDASDGRVRLKYNLFESQSAVVYGTGVLNDTKKVSVSTTLSRSFSL